MAAILFSPKFSLLTLGAAYVNIEASLRNAVIWASPSGWKGADGAGWVRAKVKARAACWAASADDNLGIGTWCGKNSTVSEILADAVAVT